MQPQYAQNIINSVKNGYNAIADHFSETRQAPWPEFSILEKLVRETHADTRHAVHLLDIGCGNGRLARDIAPTGATYTGVDISAGLITLAKEQNPSHEFVVADMTALPFADASFNFITAIASLQHVPSRVLRIATLKEITRVAQPGTTLFMTNWNLYQPHMPDYLANAKNAFGEEWEEGDALVPWNNAQGEQQAMRYYHAYTEESLTSELLSAGWNTIQHEYRARGKKAGPTDGFNIVTRCTK